MFHEQPAQLADRAAVLPEGNAHGQQFLGRREPGLGEGLQPAGPEGAARQVLQGRPPPQRQRPAQLVDGLGGAAFGAGPAGLRHQRLEAEQVEVLRTNLDHVAGLLGPDGRTGSRVTEADAQRADVGPQVLHRGAGPALGP